MDTKIHAQSTVYIGHGVRWVVLAMMSFFLFGCNNSPTDNSNGTEMKDNIPSVSSEVRDALTEMQKHSFVFGHHSVGNNILQGLQDLANDTGIHLQFQKMDEITPGKMPNVADFYPGKNTNPKSKVDGFVELIGKLDKSSAPDLAALKFCWIDFPPEANVEEIFAYYKEKIELLKKENPEILFVHMTVPLTIRPVNIKAKVKRMLGLQVWGDASNVARAKYNDLLIQAFSHEPIFDLATIEATRLDGTKAEFSYKGGTYYCLASEYTNDTGHLNSLGQHVVASELTLFLRQNM